MRKKILPNNLSHGRGCVYYIKYHIVWCTKYRRNVLTDEIAQDLKFDVLDSADDLNIKVDAVDVGLDHIHILVSCTPQDNLPDIIKVLKGNSARRLFIKYPDIKSKLWDGHLWNPSYFVATNSDITEKQIAAYINDQKVK